MNVLAAELKNRGFFSVNPYDFYRKIFPPGELEKKGVQVTGKYNGIVMEITQDKKPSGVPFVKRYLVHDDLQGIADRFKSSDFCVTAPISYAGNSRKSVNARFMYALAVDVDNLVVGNDGSQKGLTELIEQWRERLDGRPNWLPKPTFIVASGTGLHLYYQFVKPIPLFKNVVEELSAHKRWLTKKIWNMKVTRDHTDEKTQYESIFQGFRMVGTLTKLGDDVEAFRVGEPVTIEYMNRFALENTKISVVYKSDFTLEQAKAKYPEWYEKRIVRGEPKGHWICKRDLYDWWKRRIETEAVPGHRYYCMMILAIYAIKCDISRTELEKDCFLLMEVFERKTVDPANPFTEKDVLDALQSFEDKELCTYPINSIVNRSGLHIEKNKRNGRKQVEHLKRARFSRDLDYPDNSWMGTGRPSAQGTVEEYRRNNPEASKADCMRATGLSKPTVYKWWKIAKENLSSSDV